MEEGMGHQGNKDVVGCGRNLFFFFLTAAPPAYGSSQARGQTGAAAGAAYTTATATPE